MNSKTKTVSNEICAGTHCKRPVAIQISFPLGFSAGFCERCAQELVNKKIGSKVEPRDTIIQ